MYDITREARIEAAAEILDDARADLDPQDYNARREALDEARTEPAAPYDLLIASALNGLTQLEV